ncbi:MAG: hypothetical protein MI919_02015, partial [Holophagales bacterium]|nr:hypothetical protein [Holophagales bacterium]
STGHPRAVPPDLLARSVEENRAARSRDGVESGELGQDIEQDSGGRLEEVLDRALFQGDAPLLIAGSVDLVWRARDLLLGRGWKS